MVRLNSHVISAEIIPGYIIVLIQTDVATIKTYYFSLPNGDRLVTLWTDGIALDDNYGFLSTRTLSGLSDWTATGVYDLNGFEQKNITNK